MNKTLANKIIDKIECVPLREFWKKNYDGILVAALDDLLEKIMAKFKGNQKITVDQENYFRNYFKSTLEVEDKVRMQQYLAFFEDTDIEKKILEILDSNDENSLNKMDPEKIIRINDNYFKETNNEAKNFWMENYKDQLFVPYEGFFEKFINFVRDLESKEKKSKLSENDVKVLKVELKKVLIPREKVRSNYFANLFKKSVLLTLRKIVRKAAPIVEKTEREGFEEVSWDPKHKGATVLVSNDKKSFIANSMRFNSIVSEQQFEKGIHYVEFYFDKVEENLFLGVTNKTNLDLESCPRNSEGIWAIGPNQTIINDKAKDQQGPNDNSINEELKQYGSGLLKESTSIGLLLNFEKKWISIYYDSGNKDFLEIKSKDPLNIFACSNKGTMITISEYVYFKNESESENYLDTLKFPNNLYTASPFILSQGKYDEISWGTSHDKKGSKIETINHGKTAVKSSDVFYNCVLSEQVFSVEDEQIKTAEITAEDSREKKVEKVNLHYFEFYLQKSEGLYLGVASSVSGEVNCEEEVRDSEKAFAVGPYLICNPLGYPLGSAKNVILEERTFVGMLLDMEKFELTYYYFTKDPITQNKVLHNEVAFRKLPKSVRLFACLFKDNILTLTKYINNKIHVKEYLENLNNIREKSQSSFKPLHIGKRVIDSLRWSQYRQGKGFLLSSNLKSFIRNGKGYFSSILSEQTFSTGVHFVELIIEKSNFSTIIGISSKGNDSLEEQPTDQDPIWAIGSNSIICKAPSKIFKPEFFEQFKFGNNTKIGMIIDLEKGELSYVVDNKKHLFATGIPESVKLFVSSSNELLVTINKYVFSHKKIDKYLRSVNQTVKVGIDFHSISFNKLLKDAPIYLSRDKKSMYCEEKSPSSNIVCTKVLRSGIHLIQFAIDKNEGSLYFGVVDSDKLKTFNFKACPKSRNSGVWAIGPTVISNTQENIIDLSNNSFDELFVDSSFVTMVADFSNKTLSYYLPKSDKLVPVFKGFSDRICFFISSIGFSIVSITNYLDDSNLIKNFSPKSIYKQTEWVTNSLREEYDQHPILLEKKNIENKKKKQVEKKFKLQKRNQALQELHEENYKWWVSNYKNNLKVKVDDFKNKISAILTETFDLHSIALQVLLKVIDDKLNSNGNESVDVLEFREYFVDYYGNNTPIESFYEDISLTQINELGYVTGRLNPLHIFCMSRDLSFKSFKELCDGVDLGKYINRQDSNHTAPLYYAMENGMDTSIIEFLIKNKADVNSKDQYSGNTPLFHYHQEHVKSETLKLFVEHKVDINYQNNDGETVLDYTLRQDVPAKKLKSLFELKANINENILGIALSNYSVTLEHLEVLIEHKADINFAENGESPLLRVVQTHLGLESVKLLVENKADINYMHEDTPSIVYTELENCENIEILKYLVDHGAKLDVKKENMDPLMVVACSNSPTFEKIKYLLDHKLDINETNPNGESPFFVACVGGATTEVLKYLIDKKSDINLMNKEGESSLHAICSQSSTDVEKLQFLIDHKLDVNQKSTEGKSPLYYAFKNCLDMDSLNFLIDSKANIKEAIEIDSECIHTACYNSQISHVKFFLQHKIDVNAKDTHYEITPLHTAIKFSYESRLEVLQILFENKADINFISEDGMTTLGLACVNGIDSEAFKFLIEKKMDINKPFTNYGERVTPLFYLLNGAGENEMTKITLLLENKADLGYLDDKQNNALNFSLERDDCSIDVVKTLIAHKVDINQKNSEGNSPLFYACKYPKRLEIVKMLVDLKADVNVKNNEDTTPLFGSNLLDLETIKLLVNSKADIHSVNKPGDTLLSFNCAHVPFEEKISYILKLGVNPKLRNSSGWSFVEIADLLGIGHLLKQVDLNKFDDVPELENSEKEEYINFSKTTCSEKFKDGNYHQIISECDEEKCQVNVCLHCSQNCHKGHTFTNPGFSYNFADDYIYCGCPACIVEENEGDEDDEEKEEIEDVPEKIEDVVEEITEEIKQEIVIPEKVEMPILPNTLNDVVSTPKPTENLTPPMPIKKMFIKKMLPKKDVSNLVSSTENLVTNDTPVKLVNEQPVNTEPNNPPVKMQVKKVFKTVSPLKGIGLNNNLI